MAKGQLNLIIRVIPIVYEGLPESSRFLELCGKIVDLVNKYELFKHFGVKAILADDLIPYTRYLIKGHIPPSNLRYNSNDGWVGTDCIRWKLGLLQSSDLVEEGNTITYPGINERDILLAIIPASVQTTPEIWAKESHFGTSAFWFGSCLKVTRFIYHVRLINENGDTIESFFKDLQEEEIANQIMAHIAKEHMEINDPQMEMIKIKFGYDLNDTTKTSDIYDRLRVFFYGNDICSPLALKRALLLFDDIHFHDNPAFNVGNWGLIGSNSRIRQYAYGFAEMGVPLLVHRPIAPWLSPNLENFIRADLKDPLFSKLFFEGFKLDTSFRSIFIQNDGNYSSGSKVNKGKVIAEAIARLDLGGKSYDLSQYKDAKGNEYDPIDEKGLQATFAQILIHASIMTSICCEIGYEHDLIPFTEFPTFEKLIFRRYERAINQEEVSQSRERKTSLAHLSFKLFDSIIPNQVLEEASIEDVIKYRKETRGKYQEFRKYLMKLNLQIESQIFDDRFETEMKKIIYQEVIPEADRYKNESRRIWEKMFGDISSRIFVGGAAGFSLSLLPGLSWLDVLFKGCVSGAMMAVPSIKDAALEFRNLKRTNALSYLIDLKSKI